MRRLGAASLAATVWCLAAASPASAATVRYALVVGSNEGRSDRITLRWAEREAEELADVLAQVGEVQAQNLVLLRAPKRAEILAALDRLEAQARSERQSSGSDTVLVAYFSGHSDGERLELGSEGLEFMELRARLEAFDATVRVGLIDACMGGALIRAKGGRPGPLYDVRIADNLRSAGMAVITSSNHDELSQEADAAGGSYFTRALLAGLRGAADRDEDLRVTLSELYRYTRDQTIRRSARSLAGPQHPAYEMQLQGEDQLVMARLASKGAWVRLEPALKGQFLLWRAEDGRMLAEIDKPQGRAVRVLVPPGEVVVAARESGSLRGGRVAVAPGSVQEVDGSWLQAQRMALALPRGAYIAPPARSVWAGYGLSAVAVQGAPVVQEVAAGARFDLGPLSLWGRIAYGRAEASDRQLDFTYETVQGELWLGHPWRLANLDLVLGGGAGIGGHIQTLQNGERLSGLLISPRVGARLEVTALRPFSLVLGWDLAVNLFRLNDALTARFVPVSWLGMGYRFAH